MIVMGLETIMDGCAVDVRGFSLAGETRGEAGVKTGFGTDGHRARP
jgi:hypothetical protein